MKKTFLTICLLLLYVPLVSADAAGDGLPPQTPGPLKDGVRQMVQVGVQSEDAVSLTRAMVQHDFSVEQAIKAQQIVMKARQQALPTEPIVSKAFEGMAKKVPAERIVQAMGKVHARFAFAYSQASQLGRQKQQVQRMGNILAAAMAAGLNRRDVQKICRAIHQQTAKASRLQNNELALEALKTAREMARLGVSSKVAAGIVTSALSHGYRSGQIKSMRQSFMNRAHSTNAKDLARGYSNAMNHGKDMAGAKNSSGIEGRRCAGSSPGGGGGPGGMGGSGGGHGGGGAGGGGGGGGGGSH